MTTLFPQIKRVDEDETSKIIKNVLFNNQDGIKLEKIFDEFMHLTEELSYSDDDDVSDSDGTNNSNSEEDQEEDGDEEEDDDEDDEDEDDDDGDTSEDSEVTPPRGPTSWNLDQFINSQPQPQPQSPSPPLASPLQSPTPSPPRRQPKSPTPSPPQPQPPPLTQSRSHSKPKLEAKQLVSKPEPKLAQQKLAPKLVEPKREPEPPALHLVEPVVPEPKLEPEPELRLQAKHEPKLQQHQHQSQQPALTQLQLPQSQSHSQTHPHSQNHVNHNHHKHKQPSGSCIVQIDLSKLKRIPTTKAPTPTMTGSKSILTAKALKHEADVEKDKTKQAIKYLESCMYFILHGQELEKERDHSHGTSYYNDVIPLFKHTRRLSAACNPDNPDNMTHLKINALTQKCLGILYTKLYRLRERELPELAKTTSSQHNGSPIQQADELLIGVKPSFFSAYKRQMVIFDYLKNAHDNWHNAEHLCDQHPALKIFFTTIESNCGPLTMITPFSKLMDHVQCGLKLLRTS